jgi:hypothetical protein
MKKVMNDMTPLAGRIFTASTGHQCRISMLGRYGIHTAWRRAKTEESEWAEFWLWVCQQLGIHPEDLDVTLVERPPGGDPEKFRIEEQIEYRKYVEGFKKE